MDPTGLDYMAIYRENCYLSSRAEKGDGLGWSKSRRQFRIQQAANSTQINQYISPIAADPVIEHRAANSQQVLQPTPKLIHGATSLSFETADANPFSHFNTTIWVHDHSNPEVTVTFYWPQLIYSGTCFDHLAASDHFYSWLIRQLGYAPRTLLLKYLTLWSNHDGQVMLLSTPWLACTEQHRTRSTTDSLLTFQYRVL